MEEQLAIIKNINVGLRDTNYPICWFEIEMLHGMSLQFITIEQMTEMIKDAQCYKLQDLNGRGCVVEVDGNISRFKNIK